MVLFLDRVYGIEDQAFLLQMLEVGFLPDLRASASLDTVSFSPYVSVVVAHKYFNQTLSYMLSMSHVSITVVL